MTLNVVPAIADAMSSVRLFFELEPFHDLFRGKPLDFKCLPTARRSRRNTHRTPWEAKPLGDKFRQGLVRGVLHRWRGNADLNAPVVQAGKLGPRRPRLTSSRATAIGLGDCAIFADGDPRTAKPKRGNSGSDTIVSVRRRPGSTSPPLSLEATETGPEPPAIRWQEYGLTARETFSP
jgi:hypothetical protein